MANKALRCLWRLFQPIRNTHGLQRLRLPGLYLRYLKDLRKFRAMGGVAPFESLQPLLFDRDSKTQSGGGHYFFQDVWALRKLAELRPPQHNDVGSRLDGFVGQVTAICPVTYWDIRPPPFKLENFTFRQGSVLELPVPDRSLNSLSCLHTAEHIGLGRYGDPLDPQGTHKTLRELARVLAPSGHLLYSMPVGIEQTGFNAQRIWPPTRPIELLSDLRLIEFSAVNDSGEFLSNIDPQTVANNQCACGIYHFQRPQ